MQGKATESSINETNEAIITTQILLWIYVNINILIPGAFHLKKGTGQVWMPCSLALCFSLSKNQDRSDWNKKEVSKELWPWQSWKRELWESGSDSWKDGGCEPQMGLLRQVFFRSHCGLLP